MTQDSIVIYSVAGTFVVLLLAAIYQWFKSRRARHADQSRASHPDLRGTMTHWHR